MPENGRLSNFTVSPNEKFMAFLNTTENKVELWVADIEQATARKLSNEKINANMGRAINWFKDNNSLLIKVIPENRKELINTSEVVPRSEERRVGKECRSR